MFVGQPAEEGEGRRPGGGGADAASRQPLAQVRPGSRTDDPHGDTGDEPRSSRCPSEEVDRATEKIDETMVRVRASAGRR